VLRFGENSQNCEAIVMSAQWSNKSNQNNQNNQGSENDSSSNSNDRDNVNDKNTTACNQTSAALDFRWLVQARINQQNLSFELFSPGRHNLYNAIAAACCAYGAGAPLIAISKGLAAFRPVAGRSQAVTLHYEGHALTLIDDTYNANPDSVRALIDLMQEMPTSRILLLGDMGETGSNGPQFHREIGRYAYEQGIELLLTVGQQAQGASEAYNELCRQANETNDINNESSSEPNTKPNSKPDSKLNTKPDNQPDNQFSNKLNNQLNNKNDSQLTHRASNHCHDENTAARSHARCCARHFASQAAAGSAALAALPLTATVAVKGSRFMHMEQVVQMLLAACQNGAGDLSLGKGSHAT
jgi:UDP-N-acetylmuramyl pentapeptide synthase